MSTGPPPDERELRRLRREVRRRQAEAQKRKGAGGGRRAARGPAPRTVPTRHSHGHGVVWVAALVVVLGVLGYLGKEQLDRRNDSSAAAPAATTTADPVIARVTFPEGLRREEMAEILREKAGLSPQAYLELSAPGARGRTLAGAKEARSLEGFLFPATYDITKTTTEKDVVDAQIAAYKHNVAAIDYSYARSRNLTRYDVLVIASMIEREVRVPAERPLVAGVIYNRLRAGMILGIDATVQYALGAWKTELTASDLAIDSPYNTRRFAGLPPGPICNPGVASIVAAARPRGTYLYYVARNDGSGGHYFARTAEQFERDVVRSRANGAG